MKVVFRCDSSKQIGSGHLIRCLTLAKQLQQLGASCEFVCRQQAGNLNHLVEQAGCKLHLLPAGSAENLAETTQNCPNATKHQAWLQVCQQQDAEETAQFLTAVDWLVVDHYGLDYHWQSALASHYRQLLVIDDLADREHLCDAILDQNLVGLDLDVQMDKQTAADPYQTLVPTSCKKFYGPKYALLQPEYAEIASQLAVRTGEINRVLIFVGASDLHGLNQLYLQALQAPEFQHLQLDLVLGAASGISANNLQNLVKNSQQNIQIHQNLPSLAPLMAQADLMLGGGGTTNWERFCLGLNSVIVSLADNQDVVNAKLGELELIYFLGRAENLQLATSRNAIKYCLANPQELAKRSQKMQELVTGQGAEIVADYMFAESNK